jgi:hypothetical protein
LAVLRPERAVLDAARLVDAAVRFAVRFAVPVV